MPLGEGGTLALLILVTHNLMKTPNPQIGHFLKNGFKLRKPKTQ